MGKELGKIKKATFGRGGYQESMIGVAFALGGESWGVGDFWGYWNTVRPTNAKWSENARTQELGDMVMRLSEILEQAKVYTVDQLEGVPIEATFDGLRLVSWRVLTEVL